MPDQRDRWDYIEPEFGQETFTFQAGDEVRTLDDLVRLCDKYWAEAKQYLYNGTIEAWLKKQGLPDLATKVPNLRGSAKDQNIGLEAFLQMTGLVGFPQLTIDKNVIIIQELTKAQATFTIFNSGRGHLSGTISQARESPLQVLLNPTKFSSNAITVEVIIKNFDLLVPGQQYQDSIIIKTDFGSKRIPLLVEKRAIEPALEPAPPETAPTRVQPVSIPWFALFLKTVNLAAAGTIYFHYHKLELAIYALLFFTTPVSAIWSRSLHRFLNAFIFPSTFAVFFFGSNFLWGRWWVSLMLGLVVGGIVCLQFRRALFPELYDEWSDALSRTFNANQQR